MDQDWSPKELESSPGLVLKVPPINGPSFVSKKEGGFPKKGVFHKKKKQCSSACQRHTAHHIRKGFEDPQEIDWFGNSQEKRKGLHPTGFGNNIYPWGGQPWIVQKKKFGRWTEAVKQVEGRGERCAIISTFELVIMEKKGCILWCLSRVCWRGLNPTDWDDQ